MDRGQIVLAPFLYSDLVVNRILRREPISLERRARRPGRPHPAEVLLAEPPKFLLGFLDAMLDLRDFRRVENRKLLTGFQRSAEILLVRLDGLPKSVVGALKLRSLLVRQRGLRNRLRTHRSTLRRWPVKGRRMAYDRCV